jgi:hypothetical protein
MPFLRAPRDKPRANALVRLVTPIAVAVCVLDQISELDFDHDLAGAHPKASSKDLARHRHRATL